MGAVALFSRNSKSEPNTAVLLWWELLTQVMAVVELVLDHGWSQDQVGVDIDRDTFDVGVYLPGASELQPHVAGVLSFAPRGSDPRTLWIKL